MTIITETVYETVTSTVDATVPLAYVTVIEYYDYTVAATDGQTITLHPPSPSISALLTTKYTPTLAVPIATSTKTITEIDIYLQNSVASIYSTLSVTISPESTSPATLNTGEYVFVVQPHDRGWNSWSDGAQAGLIVGVILAALTLLLLVCCCCLRRDRWIVHEHGAPWYNWVHPQQPPTTVPVVHVPGPLDPNLATPYGYGNRNAGFSYNLRGGAGQMNGLKDKNRWEILRRGKFHEDRRKHTHRMSEDHVSTPAFYRPPAA